MCDYKVKIISKQMFDILVILIFLQKVRIVSFRELVSQPLYENGVKNALQPPTGNKCNHVT